MLYFKSSEHMKMMVNQSVTQAYSEKRGIAANSFLLVLVLRGYISELDQFDLECSDTFQ